jgi:two-component system phosphate regulon sensor histidine kinase PhoR
MKEMLQDRTLAPAEAERQMEELKGPLRGRPAPLLQVVHELRAPVASILTSLDVLLQGYSTIPTFMQEEMLCLARDRAKTLLSLINDLLQMGGIQHAEMKMDVLWRVVPEMRIKARLRGVDLCLDVPPALPPVSATDEHMEQVLYNLIDNAIKYTDPEGAVRVCLREGADCVVGEVEDTGIGIAPEDISRVFEEFYRADNAKEVEPYGTGLGLPIAARVVELYGGRLQVQSELGRGSKFTFAIPESE